MYRDLIDYKNGFSQQAKIYPEFLPDSGGAQEVFYGLTAQGTTASTTAVLQYGINVFTTVTSTNYAAKLPQPVTGRTLKIVNLSNLPIHLFPSNIGGQINNYGVNIQAVIPPDGRVYEFFCIENPLPGAWSFNAPAIGQYDSGVITATTLDSNDHVSAASSTSGYGLYDGFYGSTGWSYNGVNYAPILTNTLTSPAGTVVAFKPVGQVWNAITKIKVYTNYTTGADPIFGLSCGIGTTLYDGAPLTANIVTNGPASAGNYSPYGYCTNTIVGTPSGPLATNVGDPGTKWGEINVVPFGGQTFSQVGDSYLGQQPNPYGPTPAIVDVYRSGYIAFFISPYAALTGFKFRFFLEYI